jgi:hypothetical protein
LVACRPVAGKTCGLLASLVLMMGCHQAAEDTSAKIQDKIAYAEKSQEMEDARAKELQGRVDLVKKNASGDMDVVQGAGHGESMDMDDVRCNCCSHRLRIKLATCVVARPARIACLACACPPGLACHALGRVMRSLDHGCGCCSDKYCASQMQGCGAVALLDPSLPLS